MVTGRFDETEVADAVTADDNDRRGRQLAGEVDQVNDLLYPIHRRGGIGLQISGHILFISSFTAPC
ncbi:MAG: hypothetical protein MZV70_00620 [Desulfobacterales bacterium]|nr:hypothetical protein [Desulfobacterales bacterium]